MQCHFVDESAGCCQDGPRVHVKEPPPSKFTHVPRSEAAPAETAFDQAVYASRVFLDSVRRIPDVVRVVWYDEGLPDLEPSFLVVVPTLYGPAAKDVFELEAIIHRSYPKVRLEVRVKGLKERGLSLDEADLIL